MNLEYLLYLQLLVQLFLQLSRKYIKKWGINKNKDFVLKIGTKYEINN